MATGTSRAKSTADARSAQHARALARNAMNEASELTIRVLEGGRAPRSRARKKKGRAQPAQPPANDVALEGAVAPPGLRADVTPQLRSAAPAFGDVLRSLADAAAVTQTALDEAALESLKTLATQHIEVPVLIEQVLDETGVPSDVTIRTASVPLTTIIEPSRQIIEDLTVQMDMRVQSFDATSGIKFNQNMASAGVSYKRHGFGFGVSVNNTNINGQFSNLSNFSSGSVLVSMDIADRTGYEIPPPLDYGVGSSLMVRLLGVTQTATSDGAQPPVTTFTRTATLSVRQVRKDGSIVDLVDGDYDVTIPAGLQVLQSATLQVSRIPETATDAYEERTISITVGQLTKDAKFHL